MPANNPYQSSLSGMWRTRMNKPVRQGPLPLDQAYGVLAGVPNSARNLPNAVGVSGAARPMSGLPNQPFARSPQMYAFDEMYADVSQIPGMARSLSGAGRSMSGAGGLSGSAQGIGQSIAGAARAIPGSARNLSEAIGLSGAMRGETAGVPSSPMSGAWQSSTVQAQPQPKGAMPLDGFVNMLGRVRSTLADLGGARGGEIQYEPLEPPPSQFAHMRSNPQSIGAPSMPTIRPVSQGSIAAPERTTPTPPQPMPPPAPQPVAQPQPKMDPGVQTSPSPLSPPVPQEVVAQQAPPVQPMNPQFAAAGQLADQIAARRAAGLGVGAGPTAQDMEQRAAAVQAERMNNPNLRGLGDFMQGEVSAGTEAGREARRQAMDQSFLSKPMQGGGFSMADREARLSMLSPPGQRAQAESDFMARRARTGNAADEAVRAELERQGVTQEQLDNIAELRNDPDIAMGGRRAVSLLAPGTSIRTPEGGFIMRGPDRETTPEDLERKQAGRLRDVQAPMERMDKVRAGRQAMMANRSAAEQQQFDMATNPMVNPMLVANSPYALSAVIQAQQDQREFASGAGRRKLEEQGLELQNRAAEKMLDPEMLKRAQQDQAIQALGSLPQEMWSSPLGRALQARAMGQDQMGQPPQASAQPTIPQAAQDVSRLLPDAQAILGYDPSNFSPTQVLQTIDERAAAGTPIQPADMQTLLEFIKSLSIARPTYMGKAELTARNAVGSGQYTPGAATETSKRAANEARSSRWSMYPGAPR